jgi:hypothetical protein
VSKVWCQTIDHGYAVQDTPYVPGHNYTVMESPRTLKCNLRSVGDQLEKFDLMNRFNASMFLTQEVGGTFNWEDGLLVMAGVK